MPRTLNPQLSSALRFLTSLKRLYRRKLTKLKSSPYLPFRLSRIRAAIVKIAATSTTAEQTRTTIMKVLPSTSEGWSTLFQILTIALVAGTVVTGFLALYFSNKANRQQAERIATLERDTAVAEQKRAEAVQVIASAFKEQAPPRLPLDTFIEALKDKPKGKVEIMFQPQDWDAITLANDVYLGLLVGGWDVSKPIAIPPDAATESLQQHPEIARGLPPTVRIGAEPWGVTIMANKIEEGNTAFDSLVDAFLASDFRMLLGLDVAVDEKRPDNSFLIVVGPPRRPSIELRLK